MSYGSVALATLIATPKILKIATDFIKIRQRRNARVVDVSESDKSTAATPTQGESIVREDQAQDVHDSTEETRTDPMVEDPRPAPVIETEPPIRLNIVREAPEYDAKGYDDAGLDRSLNDAECYRDKVEEMNKLLFTARGEREKGNIKYSLADCREAMELGLRCVYEHNISKLYGYKKPGYLIYRCEPFINEQLYGFIKRDYDVASSKQHADCSGIITKEQANKCWITTKNLSRVIESYC